MVMCMLRTIAAIVLLFRGNKFVSSDAIDYERYECIIKM